MKTLLTPRVDIIRLQAADIFTDIIVTSIETGEGAGKDDPMQGSNSAPARQGIFD